MANFEDEERLSTNPSSSKQITISNVDQNVPMKIENINIHQNNPKLKERKEDLKSGVLFSLKYSSPNYTSTQIPFEYIHDIFQNLKMEEKESHTLINYSYMSDQSDVNEQMRAILIDWLIEVHLKFKLIDETLFLTINIIDRYLSSINILRSRLQLLGVTSLLIACKQEEIYTPNIKDFVYITDNAYSKNEIFEMEKQILQVLKFNILSPSCFRFYEIISKHFNFNQKHFFFGRYLMEVFLVDFRMLKYYPSVIACACCYIVMKFFKYTNYSLIYDKSLFSHKEVVSPKSATPVGVGTTHSLSGTLPPGTIIKECAKEICFLVDNLELSSLTAAKRKFSTSEYEQVSLLNFN
jgi:hypothetical protein